MKKYTLKYNLVMNFIRLITGILFPIIILPYITQLFLPSELGKIDYMNTVVNYYTSFIILGIPIYGMREISLNRNSQEKITNIFLEIMIILFVMIVFGMIFYFIFFINPIKNEYEKKINIIFLFNILLNSLSLDWFYQGLENQQQVTKKVVIFRIISILGIIIFVKSPKDYFIYIFLASLGLYGGNILNLISVFNYIKIDKKKLKKLSPKKHLKALIVTFGAGIAILLYTNTDIIMINKLLNSRDVAYYSFALKFIRISTVILPILGGTLLPRLLILNQKEEYYKYLYKIFSFIILYNLFLFLFFNLNASEIVYFFGTEKFNESIELLKYFSILPLMSSMSYFLGVIYLYSTKKDKLFFKITISAGIINILFNYILINKVGIKGAVISTNISEGFIILAILISERKNKIIEIIKDKNNLKCLVATFLTYVFFKYKSEVSFVELVFKNIYLIILYGCFLLVLKEKNIYSFYKKSIRR